MDPSIYWKFVEYVRKPEAQEAAIAYLAEHLGKFLKQGERVLICFRCREEGSLSWLFEQAVLRCECIPEVWSDDLWKTLLRQAFTKKITAIIGPPLILLGLMKLKRYNNTPLYIRKVIVAGYPCPDWMTEGLVQGFDCEVGGCFALEHSGIVAGFACGHSWGVHLWDERFGVDIIDDAGKSLPEGHQGQIVLYPLDAPELRLPIGDTAYMETSVCKCGSTAPRLLNMAYGGLMDSELDSLAQHLMSWTSILDCHVKKGPLGLELEIICFQGEKLPQLPSAARLIIRPFDPTADTPLLHVSSLRIPEMM